MNFILHQQKVPKYIKKIPTGLTELMEDITREVLRSQPNPENIHGFISDYLEALVAARDKTAIVQSIIDDVLDMSNYISENLNQRGISLDKANDAAKIIQNSFRSYMAQQQTEDIPFDETEILTELINKCNFTCDEILQSTPAIREAFKNFAAEYMRILKGSLYEDETLCTEGSFAHAVQKTFETYSQLEGADEFLFDSAEICIPEHVESDDEYDEALVLSFIRNQAATIIQRNFRKYLAMKKLKELSEIKDEDKINAAITIQAIFRGYSIRKKYLSGEFSKSSLNNDTEQISDTDTELTSSETQQSTTTVQTESDKRNQAATIIQAYIRALRARMEFKNTRNRLIDRKQNYQIVSSSFYQRKL